jgi:hypothetical protein
VTAICWLTSPIKLDAAEDRALKAGAFHGYFVFARRQQGNTIFPGEAGSEFTRRVGADVSDRHPGLRNHSSLGVGHRADQRARCSDAMRAQRE